MELVARDTLDIKQQLLQSNKEYRRLAQRHSSYAEQLEKLIHKSYLSEEEKIEEINLKKKKLQIKDQMEIIIQKQRQQTTSHGGNCK